VTSFGTDICEEGLSGGMRTDPHVSWIRGYVNRYDPGSCDADGICASGCTGPDPDCPCAPDGFCTDDCPGFAEADPDCAGCGADGTCRYDCPGVDVDCCEADGICEAACGGTDPDCEDGVGPNPHNPGGEPLVPGTNDVLGGCSAIGQGHGHSSRWPLYLIAAIMLLLGRSRRLFLG